MFGITVYLDEYPEWTGRSVKNYVLMLAVFGLYLVLRSDSGHDCPSNDVGSDDVNNRNYGRIYYSGVVVSCVVQYVVCYIEYIAFQVANLDMSQKYLDVETKVGDGRPKIVGLTTNPGMLVPVVLIGLCLTHNLLIRILALTTALVINSTTCMICIALCFALYLFVKSREQAQAAPKPAS